MVPHSNTSGPPPAPVAAAIADVTDPDAVGVAELDRAQARQVRAHERDVGLRVLPDDRPDGGPAVLQDHAQRAALGRRGDDVVVGEDQTVVADDHAGALAAVTDVARAAVDADLHDGGQYRHF